MHFEPVPNTLRLDPGARESLYYGPGEGHSIHLRSLLTLVVICASVLAAGANPWLRPLAWVVTYVGIVRYLGYIHSLQHAFPPNRPVPWLLEFMPAPFSPLTPTFSAASSIHHTHHLHETGPDDPDNFLIDGSGRLQTFIRCMFTIEYWTLYAARAGQLGGLFVAALALRLGLLTAIGYFAGVWPTLEAVVVTKLATGSSFYFASYLCHVRDGVRGNYMVATDGGLSLPAYLTIGRHATNAVGYHGFHHRFPRVSCARLRTAYRTAVPLEASSQATVDASMEAPAC